MDNIVKLVFESISIGSGLTDFVNKTKESLTNSGKLAQGVGVLSQSFGVLGSTVGKAVSMFLNGGVWGAAAIAVSSVVNAVRKWKEESALAAEANDKAFKETIRSANAAASAMKESYSKAKESFQSEAQRKKEDIELTKKQIKAELELAEAKARAAGKTKEADSIKKKAAANEADSNRQTAAVSVEAARKNLDAAKKSASALPGWENGEFKFDPKEWEKKRRRMNGRITRNQRIVEKEEIANAYHNPEGALSPDDLDLKKKELEMDKQARDKLIVQMKESRQAAENIADAERALSKARKEEKSVILENQRSIVVSKSNAAKSVRDELIKKYKTEKDGYEAKREPEKTAKDKFTASFNESFELWRDPEAAAQAVEADKKRGEDMKRFRKEVNRYGGKGKIDEYAALMRAGDEEGMQAKLQEWRKSSKFTPQTEQLVKAAAADQNKNAAERSLEKIQENTSKLAEKLDQLLQVK